MTNRVVKPRQRAPGAGRKPLPPEMRRIPLGLLVDPLTAERLKQCAQQLGLSEGKALDRAVADLSNYLLR